MKQINLSAQIAVFPHHEEGIEDNRTSEQIAQGVPLGTAKDIVLTEENGDTIVYAMTGELAEKVARALRMSNPALHAAMIEEGQRLKARALLDGTLGNGRAG